ncbi:hypothetical protein R6Q59_031331 [Mikania micrantha]
MIWEKTPKRGGGGQATNPKEITFIVSNLPEEITDDRFRKTFANYGNLSDAYLARKGKQTRAEYSFLGLTKDLIILENIETILENMDLRGSKVRYVGGLRVMISFPSPSLAKKFLDDNSVNLAGLKVLIYGMDRNTNLVGLPSSNYMVSQQ